MQKNEIKVQYIKQEIEIEQKTEQKTEQENYKIIGKTLLLLESLMEYYSKTRYH